ncbi:MAG: TIGR00269 family protein [Natronomonas sp.]
MECDNCDAEAVIHVAYSGRHLCGEHLCQFVESRVRRRMREDNVLSEEATPTNPETWLIGLSGGKDSAVLTSILHDAFGADPRVELVALTVHEGIDGYRDASLDACLELADELDIEHEVVSYAEEYGIEMDAVAADEELGMAPCAYCGVFRRDALSAYADVRDADKLLTGHNLDDEAQTALMNLLSGDVEQVAKHFDASLGGLEERTDGDPFVPRVKPLRDIPEREVALYAHLRGLPAHTVECPHASEAYRGEIHDHLLELEENHPGTRHSIMAGYEELARLASEAYRSDDTGPSGECVRCGGPTNGEVCRACELRAVVEDT